VCFKTHKQPTLSASDYVYITSARPWTAEITSQIRGRCVRYYPLQLLAKKTRPCRQSAPYASPQHVNPVDRANQRSVCATNYCSMVLMGLSVMEFDLDAANAERVAPIVDTKRPSRDKSEKSIITYETS
jgi:hypothetical protein